MACHICRRTGQKTCDPEEAEIRCMICGRCEADAAAETAAGNFSENQSQLT